MRQLFRADLLVVGFEVLLDGGNASLSRNPKEDGFVVILQLVFPVDVGELVLEVFGDHDLPELVGHAVVFVVVDVVHGFV